MNIKIIQYLCISIPRICFTRRTTMQLVTSGIHDLFQKCPIFNPSNKNRSMNEPSFSRTAYLLLKYKYHHISFYRAIETIPVKPTIKSLAMMIVMKLIIEMLEIKINPDHWYLNMYLMKNTMPFTNNVKSSIKNQINTKTLLPYFI